MVLFFKQKKIFRQLIIATFAGGLCLLSLCKNQNETVALSPFQNLNDSVKYVGREVCKGCHIEIYESFIQTGMGLSFGLATPAKSNATFDVTDIVFDSINNLYYKPFWRADSLIVAEYRLSGYDTIHYREEIINYIIGSGHHTNSHLILKNGYLYQAPITYYTQQGRWDLAPGFEGGFNSRFTRAIEGECVNCHNALTLQDNNSKNRFTHIPQGIDCERCHGPGELHVKLRTINENIDSLKPDYTIVHPGHLNREFQMDLCKRCHLQGISVLAENKYYTNFKPGMRLKDIMEVFLPVSDVGDKSFLMASHAERLEDSKCYTMSQMSCITCHNPHISVAQTPNISFNKKCISCHKTADKDDCSLSQTDRQSTNNSCIACHMPKSGAIDIPHVSITDHLIRIPDTREQIAGLTGQISKLQSFTSTTASDLDMAKGYLKFYEGFNRNKMYLDSANYYIERAKSNQERKQEIQIHLYYLKGEFGKLVTLAEKIQSNTISDPDNYFRIGEAYESLDEIAHAKAYFEKATRRQPENLDYLNRYGAILVKSGELTKARETFEKLIALMPDHIAGLCNLGIILVNLGEAEKGIAYLEKSIRLDSDYELAYLNLLDFYWRRYDKANAKKWLDRLTANMPQSQAVKEWTKALQ